MLIRSLWVHMWLAELIHRVLFTGCPPLPLYLTLWRESYPGHWKPGDTYCLEGRRILAVRIQVTPTAQKAKVSLLEFRWYLQLCSSRPWFFCRNIAVLFLSGRAAMGMIMQGDWRPSPVSVPISRQHHWAVFYQSLAKEGLIIYNLLGAEQSFTPHA